MSTSNSCPTKNKVLAAAVSGLVAGGIIAVGLAHIFPCPSVCRSKKQEKKEKVTTHYWNGRGLMEVPRQMLHASGVEFVDGRHSQFTGDDKCNLGRMPSIELESGRWIGQSKAIRHYIAETNGLLGSNAYEAAKCIEVMEHVAECRTTYFALVPWGTSPTEEQKELWFEGGGKESSGPAQNRGSRYLTWYLNRIEAGLTGTNGFAVGNSLSLADFELYSLLAEHLTEDEADKSEYVATTTWHSSGGGGGGGATGQANFFLFARISHCVAGMTATRSDRKSASNAPSTLTRRLPPPSQRFVLHVKSAL